MGTREAGVELEALLASAQGLSDRGYVLEAIGLATRALEREPAALEPRLRRAQFHLQRRNYAEALADLDEAVRRWPVTLEPRLKRAELQLMNGRLAEAQADLEQACALTPGSEFARLQLLSVLVQRGDARRASALAAGLMSAGSPRARQEARFQKGCLDFRLRRPGLGAREFKALAALLPQDEPFAHRVRLYWEASRVLDPGFRRRTRMKTPKRTARLYLCGLGIFPPYTASLETLHALASCDVLFNNVAGPEVRALIAEFCADVRPASYQAWQDEPRWADTIFAEVEKGRTVGFVTRGHPLVFGGLAVELIKRCRAQGVEQHTFGAVSSIDHLLAFTGQGLGDDFGGVQALNFPLFAAAKAHNNRVPLLLCFYAGVPDRVAVARVRAALERFYPGALACWMFGPKYDDPPAVVRIDELDSRYESIHASLMLYVPALASAA